MVAGEMLALALIMGASGLVALYSRSIAQKD
jgi:hypothetical protein